MTTPHKHAALIHAWADGAEIQYKGRDGNWHDVRPGWNENDEYRIKPVDIVEEYRVARDSETGALFVTHIGISSNLRLTFDAETGALKSAEVIK